MKLLTLGALFVVIGGLSSLGAADPLPWKAGVASAKITPEGRLWMAGYAARTEPAEGVELDLYAKALIVEDTVGTRFVLITMDLIGVPRTLRLAVAEQVKQRYGIESARLAINASHTHCGPELRVANVAREPERALSEAFAKQLEVTLVSLVGTALADLAPADLRYGHARCGFAMNRRQPDGKGGFRNAPNPDGPVDHAVPVLQVTGADGKERALVFGYACHCTTLGYQKFNGDYAGYAQARLQRDRPGVTALFMNGCSGDQNPYPRRSVELAQGHGQSLATAVAAALESPLKPLRGRIRSAYREIPLAYEAAPTREQLLEREKSTVVLDAAHAKRLLKRLDEEGGLPKTYPYPVQVLRLGDQLTWVMLAGEVVVDYSLRLKRELTDPLIWVSAYTNDVPTYIPSRRVWEEGGYEGGDAMKWGMHPARWDGALEEHIIGTVKALRQSLK